MKLVLHISVWNQDLVAVAFQFLSTYLVKSISFIFGSSFSHLIRSTITSSYSSSANSCYNGLEGSNSFFMNVWSSISHLICSGVGSILTGAFTDLKIKFLGSNGDFAQFFTTGFESEDKKESAILLFSRSIYFFYWAFSYDNLTGFHSLRSLSLLSLLLLSYLNGNFFMIFFGSVFSGPVDCGGSIYYFPIYNSLCILKAFIKLLDKYRQIQYQITIVSFNLLNYDNYLCFLNYSDYSVDITSAFSDDCALFEKTCIYFHFFLKIAYFLIIIKWIQFQSEIFINLYQSSSSQKAKKSIHTLTSSLKNKLNVPKFSSKDFQKLIEGNESSVGQAVKSKCDQYSRVVNDLKNRRSKDSKFIEGGAGYLKAKQDEIKNKGKVIEAITTGLKESVSKIVPAKLALLPYEKQPILKQVFCTLYQILYQDTIENYDWPKLKKHGLEEDGGEDFLTRLANINFKQLSEHDYDLIRVLKTDPKFIDVCQNAPYALEIVDIADWVDFVVEGQKVVLEKKQCEHQYDKIRKDINKRKDGSLELHEQFLKQTIKNLDEFQNTLSNLQSELKTVFLNMQQSLKDLQQLQQKRNIKIKAINQL